MLECVGCPAIIIIGYCDVPASWVLFAQLFGAFRPRCLRYFHIPVSWVLSHSIRLGTSPPLPQGLPGNVTPSSIVFPLPNVQGIFTLQCRLNWYFDTLVSWDGTFTPRYLGYFHPPRVLVLSRHNVLGVDVLVVLVCLLSRPNVLGT